MPRRLSTSSSGHCCDTSLIPYDIACTANGATRPADLGHAVSTRPAHAAAECTREIKKALSRVTAASSAPALGAGAGATDRGPARALAKLSHTNPCALWTTAVQQVKSYSNIGQYIVEAGRYMTQLSMDVATFTLVDTCRMTRRHGSPRTAALPCGLKVGHVKAYPSCRS
jgi:hypothetical protein